MSSRISIYDKIQTLAIKNRSTFKFWEYNEYIVITEGHWGVFFRPQNLLLDATKYKKYKIEQLPEYNDLLLEYKEAIMTDECSLNARNKIAIKIKAKIGIEVAYINLEYLKQFGDNVILHIKDSRHMILVTTKSYNPIGFIMPIIPPK